MFRDWQENTNSIFCSRPLVGLRQQMDVWFYTEKGTTAERHEKRAEELEGFVSGASPKRVRRAFALLTKTYHGRRQYGDYALACPDSSERSLRYPAETRQASAERYDSPGDMSMLYMASGDMDEAFAWLKRRTSSVTPRRSGPKLLQSPICCAPTAVSSSSWDE